MSLFNRTTKKRGIVCPCGHPMEATDDEDLFKVMRQHVDEQHPEKNLSRQDLLTMIDEKAFDME